MPGKFFRSAIPLTDRGESPKIDSSVAHIARIYDYWLGGKDNFAVDREVGDKVLDIHPETALSVRANRAFLARSVRYLAEQEGIPGQFLDVGTGLPSANNTHEVAQSVAPESRVVYVDNDPIVLVHARALLTSSPEGETGYLDADISKDPEGILAGAAAELIDFTRPWSPSCWSRCCTCSPMTRRPGPSSTTSWPRRGAGQLPGDLAPGKRDVQRDTMAEMGRRLKTSR